VSTNLPAVPENIKAVVAVAADVRETAADLVIEGQADATFAMQLAGEWKGHYKALEKERKQALAEIKVVSDRLKGFYDPPMEALEAAAKLATVKVGNWQQEQRRLAAIEEARAREAAEAERRRIEAIREAEAMEADARANAAMAQAEEAFATGNEEQGEAMVEQAAAAEQTAMAVRDVSRLEQTVVMESVATIKAESVAGLTLRKTWSVEPVDGDENKALATLVAAAAGDPKLLAYLQIDWVSVRKECTAKAPKGMFDVPGCVAIQKETAVNRA
jgi:hypothetical protein